MGFCWWGGQAKHLPPHQIFGKIKYQMLEKNAMYEIIIIIVSKSISFVPDTLKTLVKTDLRSLKSRNEVLTAVTEKY
jgi:hypothetical protein